MKKTRLSLISVGLALVLTAGAAFAAVSVNSASTLSSANARVEESSLGDLIADSVRASQGTDVALISASELRETEIARGKVSSADVAQAVAYPDDPIVVVKLSGKQIKQALEKAVSIYDQKNLGFLQVSGLKFNFKKSSGERVGSVTVGGDPLDSGRSYDVAMSNSLANGALGYWRIWSKDQVSSSSQTTFTQAIESFLKGKSSIDYSSLNRITVSK